VKNIGLYPAVQSDTAGIGIVSQAGAVALVETVRVVGLDTALSEALGPWRKPMAVHDPGKVITDLAITLALGGDCLADIALLRAEQVLFGLVASDATVSRTIDALAADSERALAAVAAARAVTRARVWRLAGEHGPGHAATADQPLVIDIDATLITSHSEKEHAAPTFKRGFGFHPLWTFVDHGAEGTGEPLSCLLRKGNAGSNTAADHVAVVRAALAQLPGHRPGNRPGRGVLIRADSAGGTHEFLNWVHRQRLSYSVGFTLPASFAATIELINQAGGWTVAYDAEGKVREGAWVAEATDLLDLSGWPEGMRVIVRKERPHPGAQLRITDADGHRITAFATNTARGQLADLELRHRRRARCEDRIRVAKETGLANLPLHDFAQNEVWCAIVALACELTAWMQMLALAGHQARRWEPKRLRLRLFSIAGRLARHGRTKTLHLSTHAPWAALLADMIATLRAIPAPG
jgi:hypothetical protein